MHFNHDDLALGTGSEVMGVMIKVRGKPFVVLNDSKKMVLISKDGAIESTSELTADSTRVKALQSTLYLHSGNKIEIALVRESLANSEGEATKV